MGQNSRQIVYHAEWRSKGFFLPTEESPFHPSDEIQALRLALRLDISTTPN